MAFQKVEVDDKSGRSSLYYERPPKVPITVWVMRGLVLYLLVTGVVGFISMTNLFLRIRGNISNQSARLYTGTSWSFDTTMDGRFRWCGQPENRDQCLFPWGTASLDSCVECLTGGQETLSSFRGMAPDQVVQTLVARYGSMPSECVCRELFTGYGWENIQGPAIAFSHVVPAIEDTGSGETRFAQLYFDVRSACDESCQYPYMSPGGEPGQAPTEEVQQSCWTYARADDGSWIHPRPQLFCYADYPLYQEEGYLAAMPNFLGRETLKVFIVILNMSFFGLLGVIFYLIWRWGNVFWLTVTGAPNTHTQLFSTGFIQITIELFKIWAIHQVVQVAYPFAYVSDNMGISYTKLFVSIAAIGVALAPSTRRYFSYFKVVSTNPPPLKKRVTDSLAELTKGLGPKKRPPGGGGPPAAPPASGSPSMPGAAPPPQPSPGAAPPPGAPDAHPPGAAPPGPGASPGPGGGPPPGGSGSMPGSGGSPPPQ